MIPTQRRSTLDQKHLRTGLPGSEREGDKAALEASSHEGVVETVHGAEHAVWTRRIQPQRARAGSRVIAGLIGLGTLGSVLTASGGALSAQATGTASVPTSAGPALVDSVADDPFGPADLGAAPFGEMSALLEVTLFNIDVLTLTVRVGNETAAALADLVATTDRYEDEVADSVARVIFDAEAMWSRQVFERNVGYGRLLGAMRDSSRKAAEAGYISEAYSEEFAASLPSLFGFLEEDGVKEGDEIVILVRGETVRTLYRTRAGEVLLDESATSSEGRNGSVPSFFAPESDFRKRLVESLFAGRPPSE